MDPLDATPEALPLPLVTSDLLSATMTASGECWDRNDAWRQTFGSDGVWGRLPAEDARFATDYLAEAARGQLVTHQVFLLESEREGAPLTPVLLHFHPIRLPDAHPGEYPVLITGEVLREPVSWAREQTKRRRMEVLGQMAMGIAHDLNNLLTTLLGHSELVSSHLAGPPSSDPAAVSSGRADARVSMGSIVRAARDGASLVKRIQSYIRHDKRERFVPLDVSALVGEVVTLTRPYWHNEPRRQGLDIQLTADLRPVPTIQGYPTELREVLVNLVLNAVQAMPAGGTIELSTRPDEERSTAIIEVADTGVGMPERVRRRIFEALYTTKGSSGTGMGLAVAHGIVQEHGGRIEVESAPGRGSRFRVLLPFTLDTPVRPPSAVPLPDTREARSDPPAAPAPKPEPTPALAPASSPGPAPGARLLVVDDELMVRTITAKLLRIKGHEVAEASGGHAALDRLAQGGIDLVVTDLSMPEMNGRELAATIRARYPELPVVMLTGDTDPEVDADHVGAVVKKPFQADALDAVVRRVLASTAV